MSLLFLRAFVLKFLPELYLKSNLAISIDLSYAARQTGGGRSAGIRSLVSPLGI